MRASKPAAFVLFATLAALAADASAHRLDEYLQAARIAVERDGLRVELTLTPGVAVAEGVIRAIDTDLNGVLSQREQEEYVSRVLNAVELRVDDSTALRLVSTVATVPEIAALRSGDGSIRIQSVAGLATLSPGPHRVFFRNRNAPDVGVYLANALVPEGDDVAVTEQHRDGAQSELTIDVMVSSTASAHRWLWIGWATGLIVALPLARRSAWHLSHALGRR